MSTYGSAMSVSAELDLIADMPLPALREAWRRRWGEPPQYRSRELLSRAYAYRLQALAEGDLAGATKRRITEYAAKFTADRAFRPAPGPAIKPGSTLIREWGGVRHEVAVIAQGFGYQGQTFKSLSAVAQYITGVKWNGHVFFGLKRREGAAR
jgi:hypothetical protein